MFDQEQRRYDLKDNSEPSDDGRHEDDGRSNDHKGNAQIYERRSDLERYEGRGFQPRNVW